MIQREGRGVGREVAAGGCAATNVGWAVPLAATLTATLTGVAAVVGANVEDVRSGG